MIRTPRPTGCRMALIALTLALVTACAGASGNSAAIELRLIIWDQDQLDEERAMAAAFEQEHPDISVTVEQLPWNDYWAVARASVTTGAVPDLLWMNGPNFPSFAATGLLMDVPESVNLDEFAPAIVALYELDDKQLGVPKDLDTIGLFYNEDLFDAAGVDYPDTAWNWADMQAAAKALTTEDHYGFVVAPYFHEYLLPTMSQTGVPFLSPDGSRFMIDDVASCEAVAYLRSFVEDGSAPHWDTLAVDTARDVFARQDAAMYFDGAWAARAVGELDFRVGVTELPAGATEGNVIHGLAWVALATSDHPAEALEYLEFLGSEKAQLMQAESGAVISARIGTQSAWLHNLPNDLDGQTFFDAVLYSHPYPITRAPFRWASDSVKTLNDGLLAGWSTPEICAAVAATAADSIAENAITDE